MTSKEWEDICISFDEYGMQPGTLCDNADEVINNFRKAFKDVLKDLEVLDEYRKEQYKHWNIFFNGAKMEYLLYLEQREKGSIMESISAELYDKIKKHFSE